MFWGGAHKCNSELSGGGDKAWLQVIGDEKIGFSRAISRAAKGLISEYRKEYGGVLPPAMSHDGIEDAFIEKGSTIHYCVADKWIELTGSD